MSEHDDIWAVNAAVLKHEAETPMRDHDEDGRCCLLARLNATAAQSSAEVGEARGEGEG